MKARLGCPFLYVGTSEYISWGWETEEDLSLFYGNERHARLLSYSFSYIDVAKEL
jgi:hypothetical protein